MIRLSFEKLTGAIAQRFQGGGRIFVTFGAGEPLALFDAFRTAPDHAAGLTFVGAPIPGINRNRWAALNPQARAEGTFISADWRPDFEAGTFTLRPLTWLQTWGWLRTTPLDAAVFHVSPPGPDGRCSLGVASDLAPAVLDRTDVFRIAIVNPNMPWVRGPSLPLEAFDLVADSDAPLMTYDAGDLDPAFATIAASIADLAPEGASVQFGLGKAGVAALAGLRGRRGLKIFSGMVTDPLLDLLDADCVDEVVTGLAAGSPALYARLASDARVRFEPSSFTHDIRTLAAIPRLVAVNSALEIDLFGQANAEFMGGRQISGVGGLTDFLRGARLSDGGVPIIALASSAKGGQISRITPRLAPNAVSVPRADVAVVVTEHGVADLRGLSLDDRARALIDVAEPAHRDGLAASWDEMRRGL